MFVELSTCRLYRVCKADAWNSIANEMGIPRASVEAKIHNIRSQGQRSKTLTDERHNGDGCALDTCRRDVCQGTLGYKSRNMYRDICLSGDGPLNVQRYEISVFDIFKRCV
jgi:hypothetical protein